MLIDIKRFDLYCLSDDPDYPQIQTEDDGEWVKYEDIKHLITNIQDCEKCKHYKRLNETCGIYCKRNTGDYFEEN